MTKDAIEKKCDYCKWCIFYSEVRDHSATIPVCCRKKLKNGQEYRSLSDDFDTFENSSIPCPHRIRLKILARF